LYDQYFKCAQIGDANGSLGFYNIILHLFFEADEHTLNVDVLKY